MADQQQNQPRKKNALSEYNLRLSSEPVNGSNRKPSLSIAVVKNNPQLEVRTGVENDKDYGRITAKLDTPTFYAIIKAIDEAKDKPNDSKVIFQIMAHRFINRQRSKDPMLDAKVMIGKDKEGVIYIAVLSWDKERPTIKFPFKPNYLHTVHHGDGTAWTPAEMSVAYSQAWAETLGGILPHILATEYVEPPQRDFGGGGQQGGGTGQYGYRGGQNSNGQNNGGYRGNNGGGGGGNGGGGGAASGGDFGGDAGGDDGFPF